MSIRKFVFNCLAEGMTLTEAWKAAREKYYPLRSIAWAYMLQLSKEYHGERDVMPS